MLHVCETQRTRMHATDTTATPNSRQMAVAACERSTCINPDDNLTAAKKRPPATEAWSCATLPPLSWLFLDSRLKLCKAPRFIFYILNFISNAHLIVQTPH